MLNRRRLLQALSAGALSSLAWQILAAEEQRPLERGIDWLLKQQADDGGWHSETYGALRLGAATTALAIYAFSHLPADLRKRDIDRAIARGMKFLEPGIHKRGFLACPDGSLDYPTYGTAMLATAARQRDIGLDAEMQAKFIDWVISGQLHESREFTEKSTHYGGWDLMGASQVIGLTSDTNVSATCFALEAIQGSRAKDLPRTLERAALWTERCQNVRGDGGFWFSPDPHSVNHKAGFEDQEQTRPKTYASATCDGLRALRIAASAENPAHQKRIALAERYLADRPEVEHVPGFEMPDDIHGWAMGLRFYYYQSLAKALPAEGDWADRRRAALRKQVASLQQRDGRWQNESARMREDDPLIATSLAIIALASLG